MLCRETLPYQNQKKNRAFFTTAYPNETDCAVTNEEYPWLLVLDPTTDWVRLCADGTDRRTDARTDGLPYGELRRRRSIPPGPDHGGCDVTKGTRAREETATSHIEQHTLLQSCSFVLLLSVRCFSCDDRGEDAAIADWRTYTVWIRLVQKFLCCFFFNL